MPNFDDTVRAFVAAREFDRATLSRLDFWVTQFGSSPLIGISPDDVDEALVRLVLRGKLRPARNKPSEKTGRPLAPSTINRYISQLGSVFKYAKRLRLIPRTHVFPSANLERSPEPADPDRYLRPEEVERLLKVAKVIDNRWCHLSALITLAHHSGLRKGNLMNLRWCDIDLEARTATVRKTKNGQPIVAPLSRQAVEELLKLPNKHADAFVFEGRGGKPFNFRSLWVKVTREAGLGGRNFHQLRHGCGFMLASNGVNQATVMQIMGHKTLTASARYMHSNVADRRKVIDRVFD